jgi:hypothetical protein
MPSPDKQCRYLAPTDGRPHGTSHIENENDQPTVKPGAATNVREDAGNYRCKAVGEVNIGVTMSMIEGVGISDPQIVTNHCKGCHDQCQLALGEDERRGIVSNC